MMSSHSFRRHSSHDSLLGYWMGILWDLACWSAWRCRGHLSSLGQSQNWIELVGSLLKNALRLFEMAMVWPCLGWLDVSSSFCAHWLDVSSSFCAHWMESVTMMMRLIPSMDVAQLMPSLRAKDSASAGVMD